MIASYFELMERPSLAALILVNRIIAGKIATCVNLNSEIQCINWTGIVRQGAIEFDIARELKKDPELDLIVWQGAAYRKVKASPPHRRFGVEFGDYLAK